MSRKDSIHVSVTWRIAHNSEYFHVRINRIVWRRIGRRKSGSSLPMREIKKWKRKHLISLTVYGICVMVLDFLTPYMVIGSVICIL